MPKHENEFPKGKQSPPPRLFIIFAKEAYEAVIFRRGPSEWYHVIRWNTQNDKFYPGAWVKGRIYPEKCDLSPDGKLLLYFIHQGRKIWTDYSDAWTAISHSPWLYALGLWPQGTTYGGGGRFIDNRNAEIRLGYPIESHPKHPSIGFNIIFGTKDSPYPPHHSSSKEMGGAEWTGRDQNGRLIYTLHGKLMYKKSDDSTGDICLADFNGLVPNPEPAPDWATEPLDPIPHKTLRKEKK